MARRSTRQRIKYFAKKVYEHIDRIETELQAIDELADGNSEFISENMGQMVTGCEMLRDIWTRFDAHL